MQRTPETVLCLSHLRWNFVFQRPQHLLSRCAADRRVVFFEEPLHDVATPELEISATESGVLTSVPHLPANLPSEDAEDIQRRMIDHVLDELDAPEPLLWYYTPIPIAFTEHLNAIAIVYDCMDELTMFHGASPLLGHREKRLLARADVVFTGGHSLYEHKRGVHHNIHPFPSSVDVPHFARAREPGDEPADQAAIPPRRVGFFGVIDERLNVDLIAELADARPDLHFVMIGPTAKIDPTALPRRNNIHWLGPKLYTELPAYLAGWDVAMMPFALNDSTRFISPTKTPEYLAAGKPVVSTSIRDVVRPYGERGLAWIADGTAEFANAIDDALASESAARIAHADAFLAELSWDRTWSEMWAHVERVLVTQELDATNLFSARGAAQHQLTTREER
ncbi:MAG: glycosyltransferase family 1 protein [Kofleriaceae bacterium]|nr:glycosyltransferase family 1 protein [Kofleriaceae bacterium]